MKIFSDKNKTTELKTTADWRKHCPPADESRQWVDKRSAKEMAIFWTNKHRQIEFLDFLKKANSSIKYNYACPEYATKFDDYKTPRKNDLCIFGCMNNKDILIAIEGKSDEHFGNKYLKDEWKSSINDKIENTDSKKLDRIISLYCRFLKDGNFLNLRYQLVYWLAGALDEAKKTGIDTIFLIVQEFHSNLTKRNKIIINNKDFNLFIELLSEGKINHVDKNKIIGPLKNKYTNEIYLYIGKYIVNL